MEYEVRKVRDRRLLRDFLRLPPLIYQGNTHWVPPVVREVKRTLDPSRNPYFRSATLDLFVCYRDSVPVARTSLVINDAHCRKFNVHAGFFGFYESVNDPGATRALFRTVEMECARRNIDTLEGPFNPNHYSELGMLEDRYDEDQVFFQTYNPPYYHELLASAGFRPAEPLFTARNPDCWSLWGSRTADRPDQHGADGFTTRHFRMENLREELEIVRDVFNDAFSSNWHFLPASQDEHLFAAKYLRMITDPSLVAIVEFRGAPVGVLMCVLDVNPILRTLRGRTGPVSLLRFMQKRKRVRTLVIYAVGIRKEFQRTRAFVLLSDALRTMAKNFDVLESTWMSSSNTLAIAAARRMGMVEHKHFRMYTKSFGQGGTP